MKKWKVIMCVCKHVCVEDCRQCQERIVGMVLEEGEMEI